MPRNGTGIYAVPNSFTPSTVISSTAVNDDFTDIGAELTNSVAADGQTTMTGALKHSNGAAGTPSLTFGSDTDTGVYRKGANQLGFATTGLERGYFDTDGKFILAVGGMTIAGVTVDTFPVGTKIVFSQTAAPTGWTKDVSNNDKALRVVTGTASSGGSVAFTTAFASKTPAGTVGGTAITTAQMPLHGHPFRLQDVAQGTTGTTGGIIVDVDDTRTNYPEYTGVPSDTAGHQIGGTGGGGTHTHTFTGDAINLAVSYVDVIIATKD